MVCAAWSLGAGAARAQGGAEETPRAILIVHPEGPASEAAAARLYSLLSQTLADSTRFQAVGLAELLGSEAQAAGAPADLRKRFQRAREAYDNLELDRAIKLLERTARALEAGVDSGLDLDLYTQVLIYLGASKLLVGDSAGGRRIFSKLAGINPRAEINPMIFPPSLVSAFEQETEKLSAQPGGSLDLRSKPAGATIWIDGRERGATPRHLTDLRPGAHVVRLTRLGYRPVGALVQVPAGGQETFSPTLIAMAGAERMRFLASRLDSAVVKDRYPGTVDEALRWAKADRLFFVVGEALAEAVRIDGYHFDGLASERLRARRVDLDGSAPDFDARARAFFKSLYLDRVLDKPAGLAWVDLDPDPAKVPGGTPPGPSTGSSNGDQGILKSWWFWTVVGVVVAGGAGVALGLTLSKDGQPNAGDVIFKF